ncbi:MAG: DUF4129 domain-containing protein [Thermoguttaceae bacterium]|jgi:hypothetical protein
MMATFLWLAMLGAPLEQLALVAPEESVEAGQKSLGGWPGYPWYNGKTDDVEIVFSSETQAMAPLGAFLYFLSWTILALVLAAALGLLLRAYLLKPPHAAQPDKKAAGGDARLQALPLPIAAAGRNLLEEARRHYEAGDYRQAIIYLFSYQLVQLDRRRIIRLAKGKTNRQYLRELRPRGPLLLPLVEQTMLVFEEVFFGNRSLDRSRFELCWSQVSEFQRLLTGIATSHYV